jgi:uncharacterized membrane protein
MIIRRNSHTYLLLCGIVLWACFVAAKVESFAPAVLRNTGRTGAPKLQNMAHSRRDPSHMWMSKELPTSEEAEHSALTLVRDWDDRSQAAAFVSAFGLLGLGTAGAVALWDQIALPLLGVEYFRTIQHTIFPLLFGSIFALVGVAHFVYVENFARIVPPYGTWGGLWRVPAPGHTVLGISYAEYHSYWTGVVEFLGGLWLLSAGISGDDTVVAPATLLFLLTVGVTPANLYMFTHNANPGGKIPPLSYPYGHLARFILQCGLLSNFWIMMHPI